MDKVLIGQKDIDGKDISKGDWLLTDEGEWVGQVVLYDDHLEGMPEYNGRYVLINKDGYSLEPSWSNCKIVERHKNG